MKAKHICVGDVRSIGFLAQLSWCATASLESLLRLQLNPLTETMKKG
jgi:hypothetical protein